MPGRTDRVLIAGGGIGGLATAISLGRRAIETETLERSSLIEESGAGIQLGPNATRALASLVKPESTQFFDTLTFAAPAEEVKARAAAKRINLR